MDDKWGSNPERRAFLLSRGYTPATAMTVLTRIAHWKASDGQTYTEAEAEQRERKAGAK